MFKQLIILTTTIDILISNDLIEDAKEILKNCDNDDSQSYRYISIEEAGIWILWFWGNSICRFIGYSAAMSKLSEKKIIQKYSNFNVEQEWCIYKCIKYNENCTHKNNSVGKLNKWINILDNNREN